ncbi:MAG: hypothetical protein F4Z53_13480 [Acidimicrobiales bacterium]|nr:hypothetical protein [Acidimicrobiales bacterium]MYD35347.1 hypothetical protein [Acidimicrobiales bacterium]MYI08232.1 hypothetical protein [Acidimicrobiales bacterium]
MHSATPQFWNRLRELPSEVQRVAERNFGYLQDDPSHPSLRFRKVGQFWSARVGLDHRALAVADGDGFIWVWVGAHDDYERMIGSSRRPLQS